MRAESRTSRSASEPDAAPRACRATRPASAPRPRHGRRREAVENLIARGWIARGEDGPTLTDDGAAALDRLTDVVAGVRERVAELVDVAQLQTSLETLVRGLGWEEGRPLPGRSDRRRPGHHHGRCHGHVGGHRCEHSRHQAGAHGGRHAAVEAAFERGYTRGFEAGRIA